MTVLEFRPRQASSGAPAQSIPIPAMPIPSPTPKPLPLVREPDEMAAVPLSLLDGMADALIFYSRSGFDHGIKARAALSAFSGPGAAA